MHQMVTHNKDDLWGDILGDLLPDLSSRDVPRNEAGHADYSRSNWGVQVSSGSTAKEVLLVGWTLKRDLLVDKTSKYLG